MRTVLAEQCVGPLCIIVCETSHVTSRERRTGEQAAMAVLVHDDQILGADESRDDADISQIAAAENNRIFRTLEICKALLQCLVKGVITRDVTRCACADAELTRCPAARLDDVGVLRESEIVVARERDELVRAANGVGFRCAARLD